MSTRSTIVVKQSNGDYKAIYSHFDGYPSCVGSILLNSYQNRRKINRLVAQGDLSVLREHVGRKHDFKAYLKFGGYENTPAEKNGWTTFYGRDRGDEDGSAITCTLDEALNLDNWTEWVYVFQDGKWYFLHKGYVDGKYIPNYINEPKDLKLLTKDEVYEDA